MPASTTPVPDLYTFQIGTESTWGTAVAQTAKLGLLDDLTLTPEIQAELIPDKRASLAPAYASVLNYTTGTAKAKGICTYQDMPYWLDSLFSTATPSGANPYVRAYTGALGTIPTHKAFTLAKGTGQGYSHCYSLTGAIVNEMSVKIQTSKPWELDLSFIGKSVGTDTIDSLSDRTQTPIHANNTTLYIDAVGGTIGTTAISTAWFGAELKIKNNVMPYASAGASTPFSFRDARWEATLKLTMEVQSGTKAYLDSIIGSSLLQHQIRIKATTGASAIQQFDIAGTLLKSPEIVKDQDGVSSFEFEYTAEYNSTLAGYLAASNTNTVASLA